MRPPDIALKAATVSPSAKVPSTATRVASTRFKIARYISCVLNAENGDEATIAIKPGEGDKKIAVVGGGIAGLEAARGGQARLRCDRLRGE